MKALLYFLIFTCYSCNSQATKINKVTIVALKDSVACADINEKYYFEFPDVYGNNENNFFNSTMIKDYTSYFEETKDFNSPKQLHRVRY